MEWSDILKLGKEKIMYCLNKMFIFFDKSTNYFQLASKLYKNAKNSIHSLLFRYNVEQLKKSYRAATDGAKSGEQEYEIYKSNSINYDLYLS